VFPDLKNLEITLPFFTAVEARNARDGVDGPTAEAMIEDYYVAAALNVASETSDATA
jgi:hypothetical protein